VNDLEEHILHCHEGERKFLLDLFLLHPERMIVHDNLDLVVLYLLFAHHGMG
jgi:hypothetical protein